MAKRRKIQRSKKTTTNANNAVKERLEKKTLFKQFVFDKRRYSPFSIEQLEEIIAICHAVIDRKKRSHLETLEAKKAQIEQEIQDIRNELG